MASLRIIPRYKLLLAYDVRPDVYETYQRYVLNEFIPSLQDMGIYMLGAWHTAYGNYPMRHVEFVLENLDTMRQAIGTARWNDLEMKLKGYTSRYERRVVPFRHTFQFIDGN